MIDVKSAHLFGFNDMNKVRLINGDLRGMISQWEITLARCQIPLDEETILHPMLFTLIEDHPPLAQGIAHYKRMEPNDPNRSYGYLLMLCKKEIELDMLGNNRDLIQAAIAAGNSSAPKPVKTGAVAEVDPTALALAATENNGKGNRQRGNNKGGTFDREDARERGLCFGFQSGKCQAVDGKCPAGFKHELAKKRRSPTPPRKGKGKGGDTSKIPCKFFTTGECIWGDGCTFLHQGTGNEGTAAPAVEEER
jgi:hypothetical protein